MNTRLIIAAAACAFLTACAGDNADSNATASAPTSAPVAVANTDSMEIEFIDLSSFDKNLNQAMKDGTNTITVSSAQPYELNNIPERLEKWLAAVEDSGGEIKVEADEDPDGIKSRGVALVVIGVVMKMFGVIRSDITYRPTKDYASATLKYDPLTGTINEVRFERDLSK